MTNLTRPSTLSLRRSATQALTTSRSSKPPRAPASTPAVERDSAAEGSTSERVIQSDALLQGRTHISITHKGETYQLRATRLGKLILTK